MFLSSERCVIINQLIKWRMCPPQCCCPTCGRAHSASLLYALLFYGSEIHMQGRGSIAVAGRHTDAVSQGRGAQRVGLARRQRRSAPLNVHGTSRTPYVQVGGGESPHNSVYETLRGVFSNPTSLFPT